jgi:hypothetical protein
MDKANSPQRSVSQLSTFEQCPLSYKYGYIDKLERGENFWSQAGTLGHSIFEEKDKGEISNCAEEWERRFPLEVTERPSSPYASKIVNNLYNGVLNFFKEFDGWRTTPEAIEMYFEVDMGDYSLRGYIDRLAYLNETDIGIQDYKISNHYKGEELRKKMRQLYLYCIPVKEKYGKYPKYLTLFFFKSGTFHTEEFSESMLKEAIDWANHINLQIISTKNFKANKDDFFCKNLCSFYKNCEAWK